MPPEVRNLNLNRLYLSLGVSAVIVYGSSSLVNLAVLSTLLYNSDYLKSDTVHYLTDLVIQKAKNAHEMWTASQRQYMEHSRSRSWFAN